MTPPVRGWIRRTVRGLGGNRYLYPRRAAEVAWDERQWGIGLYAGPSPIRLGPMPGVANPIITSADVTDLEAVVVADPFLVSVGPDRHLVFFEVYDRKAGRGVIAVAESDDLRRWRYQGVVLSEPFHLSFPCVFEWNGDYFLVPESYQAGEVILYRAVTFPYVWRRESVLLSGRFLVDPSICRHEGQWWMFVETNPARAGDTLRLYRAAGLEGPYVEHPASPIVSGDPAAARSAGRVVLWNGHLVRFAQRCRPVYGTEVRAYEILEMTEHTYLERATGPVPVLAGSGAGWNRFGMHHLDAHARADGSWLAAVDGWTVRQHDEPYR